MSPFLTKHWLTCAMLFGCVLFQTALGQRPNRPGTSQTPTEEPNRPGQSGAIRPTKKRPEMKLKKGDLYLFTTPNAEVTLAKVTRSGIKSANMVISKRATQQNFVLFHDLVSGEYELRVTHEDYQPIYGKVVITSGEPKPWDGQLKLFNFGDVTLFISPQSVQPGPDIRVALDGELIPPDKLQYRKNEIVIPHVPVGIHRSIQVVKHGYEKWSQSEFNVEPGNIKATVLPVELKPETIALTIKTEPEANVYRINQEGSLESLGNVPASTELLISGLLPGTLKLRVTREGYEDAERPVTLTLDDRSPRVSIELEPKVETAGGTEHFDPEINNWYPERPSEWKIDKGRGMLIRGDKLALFTGPRKNGHPFGYHGDFTLMLRLKLINGKGASWIVRARDDKNYYRFDLTPDNTILFSVCRNGPREKECKKIKAYDVIIDRSQPDDVLTIQLQVEGNRFKHLFAQNSRPGVGLTELGVGGFADESFKVGGVGVCAVGGAEFYLYQFAVILKK